MYAHVGVHVLCSRHRVAIAEREDLKLGSRRGKKKSTNKVNKSGERTGYFEDDNVSLQELVRREKDTRAGVRTPSLALFRQPGCAANSGLLLQDMDAVFAKNIIKAGGRYKPGAAVRVTEPVLLARARAYLHCVVVCSRRDATESVWNG